MARHAKNGSTGDVNNSFTNQSQYAPTSRSYEARVRASRHARLDGQAAKQTLYSEQNATNNLTDDATIAMNPSMLEDAATRRFEYLGAASTYAPSQNSNDDNLLPDSALAPRSEQEILLANQQAYDQASYDYSAYAAQQDYQDYQDYPYQTSYAAYDYDQQQDQAYAASYDTYDGQTGYAGQPYNNGQYGSTDQGDQKPHRRNLKEWFLSLSKPKKVLAVIAGLFLLGIVAGLLLCIIWLQGLPEYDDAEAYNTIQPTTVYANDHETVLARFQFEYREPLSSLDQISKYVAVGTVATEDERFYSHIGVDPIGIGRAVVNNLSGGTLEGASTITQQLVRNTILADEMSDITFKRKIREMYLALRMEGLFTKDEILLLYLNTINYGNGAYGIEAASKRYYGKSASELTLDQAALLVGIPQSPTYNNPIDFPDHAKNRRAIVLDRMVSYGAITAEEAAAAKEAPIELEVTWENNDGIVEYPYFSSYVRECLTSDYGLSTADVFQGGLKVYTTLDVEMQKKAEEAAAAKEAVSASALEVALVAVDPNTGYVKAMVGGKDYRKDQWNLATQAQRQAGSSFKTFTLIAALEAGISPSTVVDCSSMVQLPGYDNEIFNYDKISYGMQSISGAFAVSSNTGFSRLIWVVGADKVAEVAHRMGITSELTAVPSLTLGTSGVTPLEMAGAYATIANGGKHYKTEVVEIAYDRRGKTVIDNTKPEGEEALTPEIAYAAEQVMEGVIYSGQGTGSAAALASGQRAAGKTGTSENYLNLWFCGITPQLSVAVWMGDHQNQVSCSGNVADVFSNFMNKALEGSKLEEFKKADSPSYTRTFSNPDLDIQGLKSSTQEEEEEKKKKEEEEKKKEEEAKKKAEEEKKKKEEEKKKAEEEKPVEQPTEEQEKQQAA